MAKSAEVSTKPAQKQPSQAATKKATPGRNDRPRERRNTRRTAFPQEGDKHELPETAQPLLNGLFESRRLFNELVVKDTNGRWRITRDHSQLQDSVHGQFVSRSTKSA